MPRGFSSLVVLLGGMFWLGLAEPIVLAQSSAPTLRLVSTNQTVRVYWPNAAYYYLLQSTTNLAASSWINEASASLLVAWFSSSDSGGSAALTTDTTSNELSFAQAKLPLGKFYRLKAPDFLPLCSFAIFYDGLLEFSQCPAMVMNGAVHANGLIYVGTSGSATFLYSVTCTGSVAAPYMDGISTGWTPTNPAAWNVTFNGTPPVITNLSPIRLWNATNNYHTLIDIPPAGESPANFPGYMRLYNQAQIVLIVTNDVGGSGNPAVQLTLQTSVNGNLPGADPAPVVLSYANASPALLKTNLPFLTLTNTTYDQREYKTNLFTQIDVNWFATWILTNSIVQGKMPSSAGMFPTIFYIADVRNHNAKQLPSVRLMNGAQLPANNNMGFTVATPNPLYIFGNYNIQVDNSGNQSVNTTTTAYTVPAALFCDAITVLSPNWADSDGYTAYNNSISIFNAADMTINAAIITGNMPSTDNTSTGFSGGIQNFPRLLENWAGKNLYLNTSLCRMWTSQMATNQFRNPQGFNPTPVNPYYNPPTRHFSFDLNFLNPAKIPPGIPLLVFNTNSP